MSDTNLYDDARNRLERLGARNLLVEGIQAMINGAVDGVMIKLGHSVACDPALSCGYGEAAVKVALDELTNKRCE